MPITKDHDGRQLAQTSETREAIRDCLHYLLKLVAGVMDSLRSRGIYDNSMIVLTTDHGIVKEPKSALLWVKPFASDSAFSESKAPTSHAKISLLLAESVNSNLTISEISALLSMEKRKLRIKGISPGKWWQFGRKVDTYDFIYDKDGREISQTCLGEFVLP